MFANLLAPTTERWHDDPLWLVESLVSRCDNTGEKNRCGFIRHDEHITSVWQIAAAL